MLVRFGKITRELKPSKSVAADENGEAGGLDRAAVQGWYVWAMLV